ncbi:hypothetical protein JDM601_2294 [Mycolicibacter sinensis]|uniref:Uncharacterized protein n=1 Tax=Mycolicibacter sinensis (strain JDM601) TaxID=875328 RepID=F5YUR3_MYCSD|nr:hypothetical protein JDM601_2294 [Mycolicibacter sinensis]
MGHPEIAIGCKATVELDFSPTRLLALRHGAEIEEVGLQRLFGLVGPIAHQHHHAGVRFVCLNVGRRLLPGYLRLHGFQC